MHFWENDPAFADIEALARKLEAALAASNEVLLKAAGIEREGVVEAFAQMQARLLGFDAHAMQRFRTALEDKRVNTLAMGNLLMTCVLTSAVALSEFKKQPQLAGGNALLVRRLDKLRAHSTNGVALALFAWASLYAVLGKSAWRQILAQQKRKQAIPTPTGPA